VYTPGSWGLRGNRVDREKSMGQTQTPVTAFERQWGRRLPFPLPIGGRPLPVLPILSEEIYVCCIGHAFGQVPSIIPGAPPVYFVHDFLVDQSQSTGGGASLVDPIQFDLTQSAGYMYQISSTCEKHVHVHPPASAIRAYFVAFLGRQQTSPSLGGYFDQSAAQVSFQGLVGAAPNLTYNSFFITHADNSALMWEIEGEVTARLRFDAITLQANFSRAFDPGAKWYSPLSYAVPLGTKDIWPKSETFVLFGYQTSDSVDPGPFVKIS